MYIYIYIYIHIHIHINKRILPVSKRCSSVYSPKKRCIFLLKKRLPQTNIMCVCVYYVYVCDTMYHLY